jgi:predicted PhzF superfamily epimerase YddE/YHI9
LLLLLLLLLNSTTQLVVKSFVGLKAINQSLLLLLLLLLVAILLPPSSHHTTPPMTSAHCNKADIWIVDAFTSQAFAGNSAAICLCHADQPLCDADMQVLAREMNLSETAFIDILHDQSPDVQIEFGLRWFTPNVEVDLCGHATLASAQVLFNELARRTDNGDDDDDKHKQRRPSLAYRLPVGTSVVSFRTRSGRLSVKLLCDGRMELDFPQNGPTTVPAPVPFIEPLLQALASSSSTLANVVAVAHSATTRKLLVEFDDVAHVLAVKPVAQRLMDVDFGDLAVRGVIVTARCNATQPSDRWHGADIASRYFAPWVGINEDPVTGMPTAATHNAMQCLF